MGGKAVTEAEKAKFLKLRAGGLSQVDAAAAINRSKTWAKSFERGLKNSSGAEVRRVRDASDLPGPIPLNELCAAAVRSLDDFGYFRRRYLGRLSTPWQEEAGYRVLELAETPQKEYAVTSAPPGSGKSTLFTLDIPLWITCRNRGISGMIGSASQTTAEAYLRRIKNHLEMPFPIKAEDDEIELGLAVDAEATLIEDFGIFRTPSGLWSQQAIVVAQHDDRLLTQKEATWSAWGMDTTYIGGRYKICLWDDATEEKNVRSEEAITHQRNRWDKIAEKRLEPAGLLVLNGQRLSPEDLYRHNLDKKAGASSAIDHDCCDAEPGRKYHHFKYPAHDNEVCQDDHGLDAAYQRRGGCLLDPRRLPWHELETEMEQSLSNFLQVYQQEDADPEQQLVHPLWVSGGTDPVTKEYFVGCWDNDRGLCQLPPDAGPTLSILSTDPSPTKMWATGWWCVERQGPGAQRELGRRFLMDLDNRAMQLPQYLDHSNGRYSGLLEEWWQRSVDLNRRITHLIFEENAAARWFGQLPYAQAWLTTRRVTLIRHQTTHSRTDPKYGPTRLASIYKHGLVRFPGLGPDARTTSLKLIGEAQKYPKGRTDDCVMQQLFLELRLPSIRPIEEQRKRADTRRPSWAA